MSRFHLTGLQPPIHVLSQENPMTDTHRVTASSVAFRRFRPVAAGAVIAAATIAGVGALGAGTAGAATPIVDTDAGYAGIVLDRAETRLAAETNAGVLINLALGDSWTVTLPDDSIWYTGGWTPVTGDQLFDEAAARNGQVALYLTDPAQYQNLLWVISGW
ncbi:hypothetical protein CH302_23080 [Rhodococcus sp. 15-2388-1-1a]|nr:hypothetical protein CH302_23080 [Rhodococcus sp. 15-2388-1-1a]